MTLIYHEKTSREGRVGGAEYKTCECESKVYVSNQLSSINVRVFLRIYHQQVEANKENMSQKAKLIHLYN